MLEALCFEAGASCVKHGVSQFLHVLFCEKKKPLLVS